MGCAAQKMRRVDENVDVMAYRACITAYIWNKENHNLFDFENNQSTKKEIELDFSATLSIVDNQILALRDNEYVMKSQPILRVDCAPDHMRLSSIGNKQDSRVWAILRNNSDFESLQEWELNKNDIIKLGRMKLQLVDYSFQTEEQQPHLEQEECESKNSGNGNNQCRVCFSSRGSFDNPLFSPCKCIGSMKYIHLECLQLWIQSQIKVKPGEGYTQYIWRRMECEVCKVHLRSTYTYKGEKFSLMSVPRPTVPFMSWKVTSDDKQKEGMIHVMELEGKTEIKIGRVPECEIKLKDISVSRQHAIIKLIPREGQNPRIMLSDNKSKFGTLLYAQDERLLRHEVKKSSRVLYQIGRTLLYLQLKEKGKNFNNQFTCYKHPATVQIIPRVISNEMATINPNAEPKEYQSFLTQNELNQSDIVINIKQFNNKTEANPQNEL